jgi:tRNA pseudouridine38/39 synthase
MSITLNLKVGAWLFVCLFVCLFFVLSSNPTCVCFQYSDQVLLKQPSFSILPKGTAFLWHQVRYMVAVLFLIGTKKETPDVVPWLLDAKAHPRKPLYDMASEVPLVLYDCAFEEATFTYSKHVVQKLLYNFEQIWNGHTLRAMLPRAFIGGIVHVYQTQQEQTQEGDRETPLLLQTCDYKPLTKFTSAVYQSMTARATGLSYEERLSSLSDRKLALRQFHDERKSEANENPDAFSSHRREAALVGLEKARNSDK